jgi:hypothetical protein
VNVSGVQSLLMRCSALLLAALLAIGARSGRRSADAPRAGED